QSYHLDDKLLPPSPLCPSCFQEKQFIPMIEQNGMYCCQYHGRYKKEEVYLTDIQLDSSIISKDQIQQGKILGEGSFARVYFCCIKGARYAAKFFETGKPEARQLFQREVEILRKMNFINIIPLAYFIPENLVIITPYYDMD